MSVETKRTHDEFYATESHKDRTKESFKYIASKLMARLESADSKQACARGACVDSAAGGGGV